MPRTLDHKYLVGTVRHGVWEDVTQPCRIIHMCSPSLHLCGNADRIWNINPGKLLCSGVLKDSLGWSQVTDLGQSMPTRWWCFIILICSKKGHRVGRCTLVWLLATTNMLYHCINIYIYIILYALFFFFCLTIIHMHICYYTCKYMRMSNFPRWSQVIPDFVDGRKSNLPSRTSSTSRMPG